MSGIQLIASFYDCALSQLAPTRQYKHYRLDNLMILDVFVCVCMIANKRSDGNELFGLGCQTQLKLTHIIIMITAVVPIVLSKL